MSSNSESEDDSSSPFQTPKKQCTTVISSKQKHRDQSFRDEWLKNPEFKYWLACVQGDRRKAKCTICKKQMVSELTVLKNHMKTKKHLENTKVVGSTSRSTLQNFVQRSAPSNMDIQIKAAEIKICSYFAEHNIPFHTVDHLEGVLKSAFPDSEIVKCISLKRTKCTAVVCNVIGAHEKQELVKLLCSSKFSILADESTDISTNKCICIVVRFFDQRINRVASSFFELVSVLGQDDKDSTLSAKHLFEKIIGVFKSNDIPLTNIIGFGSDGGCNIMMGEYNSVASRFRELCPNIIISKCICHSLHLCASEACKALPRNCEDLARNIYNFFKLSSKRIHELKQFQVFAETKIHRILHPAQTRWLSLGCVVTRVLEQWPALVLFFNEKWLSEKLIAAEQIHNCLNNPYIKLYYYFLDWVLPKFSAMNAFFQSEKVLVATMHEKLECHYRELLLCYMKGDYVNSRETCAIDPGDEKYFLHKQSMYLGVFVSRNIPTNIDIQRPELLDDFYTRCLDFLKTACLEIRKRYDFKDSVFKYMSFLLPKNALSLQFRDEFPSLQSFIIRFDIFTTETEWQAIDDQWRQLPICGTALPSVTTDIDVDQFWVGLLNLKNDGGENLFYNLSLFALNVLSVPHSNAQCERVFSKINLIKTKCRNKLITPTINGTLLAAQNIKNGISCKEFEPPKEMIQKMNQKMSSFKCEAGTLSEDEDDVEDVVEFTYE